VLIFGLSRLPVGADPRGAPGAILRALEFSQRQDFPRRIVGTLPLALALLGCIDPAGALWTAFVLRAERSAR